MALGITSMMFLRRRWFNSDRWHSQPRSLHLQVDASPIIGREFFGIVWDFYSGAHLAGLWARCTDKTMTLLPSPWLSCGGGAFKTFEDVLSSIKSITTDMGVEAGIPSDVSGTYQCGFEAGECGPSTLKKLRDLCTFFRWCDCRDECSSYLALNGKSTEVLKSFTASLAHWWFETLWLIIEQLCKLRPFMQNDLCPMPRRRMSQKSPATSTSCGT